MVSNVSKGLVDWGKIVELENKDLSRILSQYDRSSKGKKECLGRGIRSSEGWDE
ncbi:8545_t:CDS:2 [Gigaspora rosea]|nr:8545_t:CDS:2 [Gigaspora rosea]